MMREILAGLLFCCGAAGQPGPPPITNFRFDEDYSYLRDPSQRSGAWWESLKCMPLTDSGSVVLSLGNEARLRYEWLHNDNFGDGPQDTDGYLWLRMLPVADVHAGDHLRFFGQLISAHVADLDPSRRQIDENRVDVLQAFLDFRMPLSQGGDHATVRAGRQMLGYGSERLISNRYGPNVPETFDGFKAFTEFGPWRADLFCVRPVESNFGELDDPPGEERALWSLYVTRYFEAKRKRGVDAYYIGYSDDSAEFNQGRGDERRHTLGTRLFGTAARWDWNGEGFYQFGTFGQGDIQAWSFGSETGYTLGERGWKPRLSVRANIVSGDEDSRDVDLQTFNALFPKGKYFGEMGLLGPYNLINLHPMLEVHPHRHWTTTLAGILYWRESTNDGIYDNSGNLLRGDKGSGARFIGGQAELVVNYHPTRNLECELAVSQFQPGRFIEETGSSQPAWFASAELRFTF